MDGCVLLSTVLAIVAATTAVLQENITTDDQLLIFKHDHPGTVGLLTTSSGYPVALEDTVSINTQLIYNPFFLEQITHLDRERIPARVVHSNGAGAFGYFKVTQDLSDICKAQVFSTVGKITPVSVRFSLLYADVGESELTRQPRGFSIKFYTEEGNFDLVGLNIEVFLMKDPIYFPTFIHSFRRNPKTNVMDWNAAWDFLSLRPETLYHFMWVFGDRGIPDGYRHLPGYGIHTFELYNKDGKKTYVRFHILPNQGIKDLTTAEAMKIRDPDYSRKDLYNAIANGNYPSWNISVQVIKSEDVNKTNFDIFDVTKSWPLKEYPLREIGQLVLNENPENYFADIEQLVFCPGNLVPGIRGVDTLFESRILSYKDTQYYRLGANNNKIIVNRPLYAKTYDRDGSPPVLNNGGDSPNYEPNSFKGPVPYLEENRPPRTTVYTDPRVTNFDQARDLYISMSRREKCRLISNIVSGLKTTAGFIQDRAVKWYKIIDFELGTRIESRLRGNQTFGMCVKE